MSVQIQAQRAIVARSALSAEWAVALVLMGVKLGTHLALATRYGRHRDEYYFIDCGQHLSLGYVDHAPLVPWMAWLSTTLFGDSLFMLRLPSILAGGATVWLTIVLARRFGADALGQALAGLAVVFAPAFLRMHGMLDIPAFEPVFWTLAALLLTDLIDGADKKRWLLVGVVVGVGLLNKHTMLLFGFGLGLGVLMTPLRTHLRTPWPWLGAMLSLAIFAPNLVWQAQHGWPTLEFTRLMHETVLADIPRVLFGAGQLLYFGALALPIWLCGLVYFFSDRGRRYRIFGILFLGVLTALLLTRAKPYYSAPAYPLVFAAGGAWLGAWFEARIGWRRVYLTAFVGSSLVLALLTLPVFPLPHVDAAFEKMLGWAVPPRDLTHDMHDEVGWPAQSAAVAAVFASLPEDERRTAALFTSNYGEASALNLHGKAYGLPRATSGHMTHYLWGPDESRTSPLVVVGGSTEKLALLCHDPVEVSRIEHDLAMENDVPIYLCHEPRPLESIWPQLKRFVHGSAVGR